MVYEIKKRLDKTGIYTQEDFSRYRDAQYRAIAQLSKGEERDSYRKRLYKAVSLPAERWNSEYKAHTTAYATWADTLEHAKADGDKETIRYAQQRMDEADKQAQAILATAREAAERYHDKAVQDTQKELQELAVTAAEKLVLQSDGDALDQFLDAAERGSGHEHTQQ